MKTNPGKNPLADPSPNTFKESVVRALKNHSRQAVENSGKKNEARPSGYKSERLKSLLAGKELTADRSVLLDYWGCSLSLLSARKPHPSV